MSLCVYFPSAAWEPAIAAKIERIRTQELRHVRTSLYLNALNQSLLFVIPALVAAMIMCIYASLGHEVNVTNTFSVLAYLNILRNPTVLVPMSINSLAEVRVSLKRMQAFLALDELKPPVRRPFDNSIPWSISVRQAVFLWAPDQTLPSLRNITMQVRPGSLVAIIGQVGSSKSSLIAALLGEMVQVRPHDLTKVIPQEDDDAVLINGRLAYVSQEAWIRNDTVRGNILFGLPYNEHKYTQVLEAACLRHDIAILPHGDSTEIGERGINLSGGQVRDAKHGSRHLA